MAQEDPKMSIEKSVTPPTENQKTQTTEKETSIRVSDIWPQARRTPEAVRARSYEKIMPELFVNVGDRG